MKIRSAGHAVFAATLIGLGVLGFIKGDFTVMWAPVPKWAPAREALVYLCAFISVATGIGLFWRRTAPLAARVLLVFSLAWLLAFRVPPLFRSLAVDVYWPLASMFVMTAAAVVVYGWFAGTIGTAGLRIARSIFGLAMIWYGVAHFQYLQNTASLVPGWLPAHVAFSYFTGAAFIAAGLAIITGVYGHLATVLVTWQMGLFLLLVWIPRLLAGSASEFQRGEAVINVVLVAAAWVVAES